MPVSFPVTASDQSISAGVNPAVLAPPVNTADGDLLIAWVIARTGITSAPAAWGSPLVSFTTNGTFAAYALAVPTASALPANWTWTLASTRNDVIITRVPGTNLSVPPTAGGTCGAGTDQGNGTTYSGALPMQLPGVTAAGGWMACVGSFFIGDGSGPSTDLVPGGTLLATATTTTAGPGRSSSGIYGAVATGATGTIVCLNDWPGSPTGQDGVLLALTAASGGTSHPAAAALTGSGTLTAGASKSAPVAAALTGSGTLTAGAAKVVPAAASLSGSGSLTAGTTATRVAAASLSGSGSLTAGMVKQVPAAAALSGSGTLAAAVAKTVPAAASLSGSGSLTAGIAKTVPAAASLSGSGTLTAAAGVTHLQAAAPLSGSGTLTAAASRRTAGRVILVTLGRARIPWSLGHARND